MKTLYTYTITWVLLLSMQLFLSFNKAVNAQTADPGISFILVSFDQAPVNVVVEKAPLRYNKKFALSFHTDDGIDDVYTVGFPFFTGINEDGTNYPGLFYTDGCGNALSFKISNSVFSYSEFNDEDMHQPDNNYNTVTWPQLQTMVQNGCAIYNHGFTSGASSEPDFMLYSIKRNESYIRRQLYDAIPGGLRTRVFVNPNGVSNYTSVAFNNGYRTAFRIGGGIITENGVDVNNFIEWDQNNELNRLSAENTDVATLATTMANAEGNWWAPVFTHRIIEDYPQATFFNDFNTIASNYGIAGQDNIWMASEEEILDYLRIRELTTLTYNVAGNTLLILLEGQIPTDQRFYPLSLTIEAEGAVITNININGGTNNSFNGIGTANSLINLEWDGREIEDPEILADEFVTLAEQTQAQYDCLIAMDYVLMMPPGEAQQTMKDRLCAIPDVEYEAGFCETCDFDLGPDIEICQGECVLLEAPVAEGNTYLWSNDSTTSSILVCPEISTTYWVDLLTEGGCEASDTITINVLEAPMFDLGPNLEICQFDSVSFELPFSEDYTYLWIANTDTVAQNVNEYGFIVQDTVSLFAEIGSTNGCISTDSVVINALIKPQIDWADTLYSCLNDTLEIVAPSGAEFTYNWFVDGELQAVSDSVFIIILSDTLEVMVEVIPPGGCMTADSVVLMPLDTPVFDFPQDIQLCTLDTLFLEGPTGVSYSYSWYADGELLPETDVELQYVVTNNVIIKLEVTAATGCMATDSLLVNALEIPIINVDPQQGSLCFGSDIELTLTTQNAIGFQWWNGNTNQTITFDPPLADSTYYLWAEAINGFGCTARDTAIIEVQSQPEINLEITQGSSQLCTGEAVELSVSSNNHIIPQYVVWNNTDTTFFGSQTTISKSFDLLETTWVKAAIFSEIGCSSADSLLILVYETPEITVSEDVEVCFGESITLEASGGISCEWYNSTGLVGSDYILEIMPEQTDAYFAVVSNNGPLFCSATDTVDVTVRPNPSVTASSSETAVCAGTQIELAATGALTYTWSNGETGSPIFVFPLDTTTYQVVGSNEFGCVDTAEVTIEVFPRTVVTISGLLPVYCQSDEPSQLIGTPEGGLFAGAGMVAGFFNPELAGDGTHQIVYSLTNEYGCTDSATATTIVFGGLSSIDLGNDTLICPNDTLRLDAGEGFTEYYWNTGATTQQITILGSDYQAGTSREISVVGVLDGCTASGKMRLTIRDDCFIGIDEQIANQLTVSPNPGTGQFQISLPDGFLPEQFELIELNGKAVPFTYDLSKNKLNLSLKKFYQGVLLLRLVSNYQTLTTKIIVY